MHFHTCVLSERGGRAVNQDYLDFRIFSCGGIWALADGLGGYQGGEIAAKHAVDTLIQTFKKTEPFYSIKEGIEKTQKLLHMEQKKSTLRRSMRTTIVVLTCRGNKAYWGHIGDSRLYHFRSGELLSQTMDHSVCQALVKAGEITVREIRFHEDRNRLFRVLGSDGDVKATFKEGIPIDSGDAFLLCSDGFWEYVMEEEMESTRLRAASPGEWLDLMEALLKGRVDEGHDNYSALAVFVKDNKS